MPSKVSVVGGTGDLGFALATRWAQAGVDVTIGSREQGKAEAAADKLKSIVADANVSGMENAAAVASSPIVLVAVPFSGMVPIYKSIADAVTPETVVIDSTVPVEASLGAKATHVFGVWEGSAAQLALAFLPKGTKMCAAFHTLSASAVGDLDTELDGDVLVCGSKAGKLQVKELVELLPRLRYVDAGPLENARIIEPITALLIGINHRYDSDRAGIAITGI
ncbi:MAG: NADPH-dependent F420 reductase [Actinomycetota bacterium]|nr:NADPH-dependent F420 reductase [Actinomycetota bacterium]